MCSTAFGTEDLSCTTDYPLTNNRAGVSIYSKRIWRVKISLLTEDSFSVSFSDSSNAKYRQWLTPRKLYKQSSQNLTVKYQIFKF